MRSILAIMSLSTALAACGEGHAAAVDSTRADSVAGVAQDSINRTQPGYIVDSILPMEEQLRRFRVGLREAPHELVGGESSGDALVQSFVRSLESADTAALVRLTISRAEFAYLVFPDSPFSKEPYAQAPDLVWMRHSTASATGIGRLLDRFGGRSIGYRSWHCDRNPAIEGKNRLIGGCRLTFSPGGGDARELSLFAAIIEREGRYKVFSYDNAF
jgi:hypothetical protein